MISSYRSTLLALGWMVLLSTPGFSQKLSGDFNGDGFDDLAVGVPLEGVGTVNAAGAVNVIYGSAAGLQATGLGGPNDQFWHQDSVGVLDFAEPSDHCGYHLAVGDFNNDGFDDLVVNCRLEESVFVIYGSATGLQASGVGGPDDQFWTQNSVGVLEFAEPLDEFGSSLATADFNSDGFDDLAIGVPGESVGSVLNGGPVAGAGAVNVIYGSAIGLQATGVGGPNDQLWHQDVAGVLGVAEGSDWCGHALTTGYFNKDAFADLAFGCPREDFSVTDDGSVNVVYGSATGLQAMGIGGPNDQLWTQDRAGVLDQAENSDRLGESLASGDFNRDGFDDLVIGVIREDISGVADAGAVNVIYGAAAGLQSGVGGPDDQFWNQDSASVAETAEFSDQFGAALVTGDFNNDGFADLAIGVNLERLLSAFNGVVHVIYGSWVGLQASGLFGPNDQLWHQDIEGVLDQVELDDFFGGSLTTGDYNNDGFSDLAAGNAGEEVDGARYAGAVNVLYGSATVLQATGVGGPDDQFWSQNSFSVLDQAEYADSFGESLPGSAIGGGVVRSP